MATYPTKVFGDFIELIDPDKLVTRNYKRIATLTNDIDKMIQKAVEREYRLPPNMKTSSLIIGRKTGKPERTGKNIYRFGISYAFKPLSLSRFVVDVYRGNIEPKAGKRREGWVHEVQIKKKGRPKISYGKFGFGGFIIREAKKDPKSKRLPPINQTWKHPIYGTQMFERVSEAEHPLHHLVAPTVSMMIGKVLQTDKSLSDRISNLVNSRLITFK